MRKLTTNFNYFRYGRDYYIREAKKSAGSRKKTLTDYDQVSLDAKLNDLEESLVYLSLPRRLYSAKNSSKHFVRNPLLDFVDFFDGKSEQNEFINAERRSNS